MHTQQVLEQGYDDMQSVVRTIIFCILFMIGFGSMAISFLAPEFKTYYNNLQYKEYIDFQIKLLEDQRTVYSDKLTLLYGDPEIKRRLGRVVFGVDPKIEDTFFPEPGDELIAESLAAVGEIADRDINLTPTPKWIKLVNIERNRNIMLYCGMLIAALSMFFFLDPKKEPVESESSDYDKEQIDEYEYLDCEPDNEDEKSL